MNKVTVVIPNYNGIRFLNDCLTALYAQEPDTPSFQVVVVDNGSEDGSAEEAEQNFPRARVIRLQENTGFDHAVNVGIEATDSPYIILLNNDTKVMPGFVKALYHAIEKNEKIFSVSAKMLMWDNPALLDDAGDRYCVLGWAYARGKGKPAADYGEACKVFSACAGAAIYRRSVFKEIGLFDEEHFAYLEDLDIGYRALLQGYENYYEPSAEVIHYGSASSGSRYNEFKTVLAAANSVYVIWKNMPLLQWLWNLPFFLVGYFVKLLFFSVKGMGGSYLKGIGKGFRKIFSKAGRKAKVPFRMAGLKYYFRIQWQLYVNTFKIIKKN